MTTLRIQRKLDSSTLDLPELKPLIGKTVEIIVRERAEMTIRPGSGDWQSFERAADDLEGYDFDAWKFQRERDQGPVGVAMP